MTATEPITRLHPTDHRPPGCAAPDPSQSAHPAGSAGSARSASVLVVRPWFDPALAARGFEPRSEYVERFWLGVVGPSVVLLLRRLARGLEQHPTGFTVDAEDTARAIGLGTGNGRNAPLQRTLDRACLFSTMRRAATGEYEVRTHLPRLSARQLDRLPGSVSATHRSWVSHHDAARRDGPPAA